MRQSTWKKQTALLCLCSMQALNALPSGGEATKGHAVISNSSNLTEVHANGKAVIQWKQFDIAQAESLVFFQSQAKQAILNRVGGKTSSQIFGKIQANCPVYLINQNGVYIGSSAQIETAGWIASTADISDDMFWSDESLHFEHFGEGTLVNLGSIRTTQGELLLVSRKIDNQGHLEAIDGLVTCATTEFMLHPGSKQPLFIRLPATDVSQEGPALLSVVGNPYEQAICHTGSIEVMTTEKESRRIYLIAGPGLCHLDGSVSAPSGNVQLEANAIHLGKNARIDVSSETTAGTIHGEASIVEVDAGALLAANALQSGDGGRISFSAQENMVFEGLAQVRGGPDGGDGGTIRISSFGSGFHLGSESPIVDGTASKGKNGQVLFDPKNIMISSDGMDSAAGQTFGTNPMDTAIISGATLQMALDAAQVTLQANTDISFEDDVIASTLGNGLTLQAGRSISFNGQLTLNNADFMAIINDSGAIPEDRDAGVASFTTGSQSQIVTQGGDLTVNVGTYNGIQEGEINIFSSTLDAGGGDIFLTGIARQNVTDNAYGISIGSGAVIQTAGSGSLTLIGTGGNGANINVGIYLLDPSALLQTAGGLMHLVGYGGGNGTGNGNVGIASSAMLTSLGSGVILLEGFGGSGVHFNMGTIVNGGEISTADSSITINGTGSGTGAMNFGVRIESQARCSCTGSGDLIVSGISGSGKNNNHGVLLSDGTLSAHAGSISITGEGRGSQNYNYGIRLETGAECISTNTATITLQGQNSAGLKGNAGVSISTGSIAITSGYGDIQISGTSNATDSLNQGIRIESGQVLSTGTGAGAAQITLTGVGGPGTDFCNGVTVLGVQSAVSSVDGNILVEGTTSGNGTGNQPIVIDPPTQVNTTGSGTVTYVEH